MFSWSNISVVGIVTGVVECFFSYSGWDVKVKLNVFSVSFLGFLIIESKEMESLRIIKISLYNIIISCLQHVISCFT